MRRIGRHLTYSNVMVTILAFIVLTGGTAVALDGMNTVFSDDIKNDEVRSADVRNDSLSSGGLAAADLRPGSVGSSEVQTGSIGPVDVSRPAANVVKRVRGTASVGTGDGGSGSPVSYPLTNNVWTQKADEVETITGELAYEPPPTCSGPSSAGGTVILSAGAEGFGIFRSLSAGGSGIQTVPLVSGFSQTDFEPGTPDQHTLTAEIWDSCTGAGEDFIVHSIKVDIVGFR
jgi:hypothetical protein